MHKRFNKEMNYVFDPLNCPAKAERRSVNKLFLEIACGHSLIFELLLQLVTRLGDAGTFNKIVIIGYHRRGG